MFEHMDKLFEFAGVMVTLLSALSSYVNHVIREKQAAGAAVSPVLLSAGTVLNVGAINLDKALQLGKQLKALRAAPPADDKQAQG